MEMNELRSRIDAIDSQMVDLYKQRMDAVSEIGEYKRANKLPIYDSERERNLLNNVGEQAGAEYESGVRAMFQTVMESSRAYQQHKLKSESALAQKMNDALANTDQLFPPKAMVACQGVEGAYSQIACEKLFSAPSIMYCRNFESVFAAIESGLCRYGILPLENTVAGSVNSVYDQMISHNFYIVRSTRIKVAHSLLAKPGATISRQEAMTILSRTKDFPEADLNTLSAFSDSGKIAGWARTALAQMAQQKIISGSKGKLNPTGNVTRAEVAKMLYGLSEL